MQTRIDAAGWPVPVHILGVNGPGLESGNAFICDGRDIPWLQDTAAADVWGAWNVTYRDVIVLNQENEPIAVYNLTEHGLNDPANFAALMDTLRAAAGGTAP